MLSVHVILDLIPKQESWVSYVRAKSGDRTRRYLYGATESRSGPFAEKWNFASSVNNRLQVKNSSASTLEVSVPKITTEMQNPASVTLTDDRWGMGMLSDTSIRCCFKWCEAHLVPTTNVCRTSEGFFSQTEKLGLEVPHNFPHSCCILDTGGSFYGHVVLSDDISVQGDFTEKPISSLYPYNSSTLSKQRVTILREAGEILSLSHSGVFVARKMHCYTCNRNSMLYSFAWIARKALEIYEVITSFNSCHCKWIIL